MYSTLKNLWFCRHVSPATVLPASDDWQTSCSITAIAGSGDANTIGTSGIGPNGPVKKNTKVHGGVVPNRQSSHRIMGNRSESVKFGEEFSVGDKHRHG
jgi:hypothetical protein